MRNIVEILARLEEAEKIRDEWISELEKARKSYEPDLDYMEYCRHRITQQAEEVTVLKWVLDR